MRRMLLLPFVIPFAISFALKGEVAAHDWNLPALRDDADANLCSGDKYGDDVLAACSRAIARLGPIDKSSSEDAKKDLIWLLSCRAQEFRQKADWTNALADYRKAIELPPPDPAEWFGLYWTVAETQKEAGNLEVAKRLYDVLIDITDRFRLPQLEAELFVSRGRVALLAHEYKIARADFVTASTLDPSSVTALDGLGESYFGLNQTNEAIEAYTEAIRVTPSYSHAYYNRGRARQKISEFDLAIADYSRAIDLDPTFADAFIARGDAYAAKGNQILATADYAKAEVIKVSQRSSRGPSARRQPPPPESKRIAEVGQQIAAKMAARGEVLRSLPKGRIVLHAPDSMVVGDKRDVSASVGWDVPIEKLRNLGESPHGQVIEGSLNISDNMVATLSGPGFTITDVTPAEQSLTKGFVTEWKWKVTADSAGDQELEATLYALIPDGEKTIRQRIDSYKQKITVKVRPQSFAEWLQSISRGMDAAKVIVVSMGGIITASLTWFGFTVSRRRKKRKSRPSTRSKKPATT